MQEVWAWRRARCAFGIVCAAMVLSGCQDAVDYVVFNGCDQPIQVWDSDADVESEDTAVKWTHVDPGAWEYSSTGPDLEHVRDDYTTYVRVRLLGGSSEIEFEIPLSELKPSPDGIEGDVGIVIEGDNCPNAW